ncbi:hypothetical protein Pcinc_034446 [Petrolisthes cinctipes]|uniref:Uncharacterized protein n=1 Tax=Petrolisthes cinctipes TaxID=88211 RepID=A0AAE1JWR8_PETCI|nr:hypothetical protein Pcinc_034446 [Petrolisthes cinctipes]
MTKFVTTDEIGKVSAVLGALDGTMPMLNSAVYTAVYHTSVSTFPSAHFFMGAAASFLMILFFCVLVRSDKSGLYDIESAKLHITHQPVVNKSLVTRTSSLWLPSDKTGTLWLPTDALALAVVGRNSPTTTREMRETSQIGREVKENNQIGRENSQIGLENSQIGRETSQIGLKISKLGGK